MASEYPDIGFSKLYRKPIFFILLGIVVFALVWKIQNKWITIPIGVIAAITVLFNLQVIQTLLTVQAKYKGLKDEDENVLAIREEPSSPLHQKIVYYLFLGMFIPLSYGLTYTGKLVENFLYWKPFIQGVLIYGSIAGFVLSWFYHKKLKVVFEDKKKAEYCYAYEFSYSYVDCFPLCYLVQSFAAFSCYCGSKSDCKQKKYKLQ